MLDNIITFRRAGLRQRWTGEEEPVRAAVVLRQGRGALFARNTIRVESGSAAAHGIYVMDDAPDVTVRSNRFAGAMKPVTFTGTGATDVRQNSFERGR